jgi:hypothetical protein
MTENNQTEQQSPPWYRISMVWLMIGLPATVVVASLFTAVIAYQNAPEVTTKQQTASS